MALQGHQVLAIDELWHVKVGDPHPRANAWKMEIDRLWGRIEVVANIFIRKTSNILPQLPTMTVI